MNAICEMKNYQSSSEEGGFDKFSKRRKDSPGWWEKAYENWESRKDSSEAKAFEQLLEELNFNTLPGIPEMLQVARHLYAISNRLRKKRTLTNAQSEYFVEERIRLANRFNKLASSFHAAIHLEPPLRRHGNIALDLSHIGNDEEKWAESLSGYQVANDLLSLVQTMRLHRLRRCENCWFWIFAIRDGQRFCTAKCRRQFFESKEEIKKRRNAKRMEDYWKAKAEAQQFFAKIGKTKVRTSK